MAIRQCAPADLDEVCAVVNDAAVAYRGIIAADRWKDPYMPRGELQREVDDGVVFWGAFDAGRLVGVMGLQNVKDVALIRHAYTRTAVQGKGAGRALLEHLLAQTDRPILIGTWTAAEWAIRFYEHHGFTLVGRADKELLLRRYWAIPERQIEESVVLADARWLARTRAFRFDEALPLLRRTPAVVRDLLTDLPVAWTEATEGPGTWSPFDVVGHLIHGERTDWMPRVEHILRHGTAVPFPPFDREAMFDASKGQPLAALLDTFARLRTESLDRLASLGLTDGDLSRRGRHPEFGEVTLGQHLSTWVVHDLGHIRQMVRVMARQYGEAVGPWRAYLSIL